MEELDPRIVRVGIVSGSSITWYEGYKITAKGTKVTSSISAEVEIDIHGLKEETRNFILRNTKPGPSLTRDSIGVILEAGRESYGSSVYFQGDVFRSFPLPKPDMGVKLKCLVGYNKKRKIVQRGALSDLTSLRQIASWVAEDNGYKLSFEIPDKNIKSYSFTGSAHASISNLESISNAEVYVDNDTLFVKQRGSQSKGTVVFSVNNQNRTLLEAQAIESGVQVKMIFNPSVTVGSVIDLESEINPSINGRYSVYKCIFDIAKRGPQFYLTIEASKR